DEIVSVWSEKTAYMEPNSVARMLLVPGGVRLEIERKIPVKLASKRSFSSLLPVGKYRDIIGAELKYVEDGLIIDKVKEGGPFWQAGISRGDMLLLINGTDIKYMPFEKITGIFDECAGSNVEVLVKREVVLW
ncbi:MAG: PDZ domain-containing protein, partial [Candidatus Omnitrophica bacterium]|nr:PDZ domain-containing protein [Candidatus Omnitrophota bacterium]